MAVYVDMEISWPWQKNWPYGKVSHLYADMPEQLHKFAIEILGLKREWCSDHTQPDSRLLHYDLSPGKRKQALANGAIYDKKLLHRKKIESPLKRGRKKKGSKNLIE